MNLKERSIVNQEALLIRQKHLPPVHPSLAVTYHSMSDVLERLYRYQEAVEIVRISYRPIPSQVEQEEVDLERLQAKL
jgi:hypothetical protein